jgi:hypothetical protein
MDGMRMIYGQLRGIRIAMVLCSMTTACVPPRSVDTAVQCATDSASVNAARAESIRIFFDPNYPSFAPFRTKWGVRGDASALRTVSDPRICSAIAAVIGSPVTGQPKPRSVVVLQLADLFYAQSAESGDAEFVLDRTLSLLDFFIAPS